MNTMQKVGIYLILIGQILLGFELYMLLQHVTNLYILAILSATFSFTGMIIFFKGCK